MPVFLNSDRPGDAPDICRHIVADLRRERAFERDVADRKATARLEHARDLTKDLLLVRGQVNHTVADHTINTAVAEWKLVYGRLIKLDVGCSAFELCGVAPRKFDHFRGHIDPNSAPRRADFGRREKDIQTAAGAQIDHGLTFAQPR